ncbi:MAG: type II toxin-antitoxin system RelE/ParE family toxin [Thiolinea sp.]
MPQLVLSPEARGDIERFADFLIENGAVEQAQSVFLLIAEALRILEQFPETGRVYPIEKIPDARELAIKYGKSGYVALYTVDKTKDLVVVHAIRHQRELGYRL